MAQYNFTIHAVDSAVVDKESPNSNYYSQTVASYSYMGLTDPELWPAKEEYALIQFSSIPSQYRKKKITSIESHIYGYSSSQYKGESSYRAGSYYAGSLKYYIDLSAVTYNTIPSMYGTFAIGTSAQTEGWQVGSYTNKYVNEYLKYIPDTPIFMIYGESGEYMWENGKWKIHTAKSSNKPYLVVYCEDYQPEVINCSPTSGFINEKEIITFRWELKQSSTIYNVGQSSAVFRWKQTGQSTIHTINVSGSKTEVTVPANTFTGDSIQWQIQVTSDDGVLGVASDWFTLNTVDGTPTATPVSPIDAYVDASDDNIFQYRYSISTNTSPTRYEMQYSANNGDSWVDFSSGDTSDTSVTIPKNTLPAGNLLWRVRSYNTDGVASTWSSPVQIVSKAAPPQPSLNIMKSTPRPLFQWQSDGQVSYRFWVQSGENILFDTKETPGTEKTIRLNDYLNQGTYTAYLWVKNSFGLKSPEATVSFGVDFTSPNAPSLSIETGDDKAILFINGSGFSKYYVFRDEILIGKLDAAGKWEDHTASGEHIYRVRGVTKSDIFADSEQVPIYIPVNYAVISDPKLPDQKAVLKLRRGEYPVISGSISPQAEGFFYAGRSRPVYHIGEFIEEPISMSFSVKTKTEFDILSSIMKKGKTLLYRDYRGERFFLTLTSLDYERDPICYDFSLSGQKVDYVEEIEYDPPEVVSE